MKQGSASTPLTQIRHWRSLCCVLFVETHVFTRLVQELLSDDELAELQAHLAKRPRAGAVIQGTGGLRKVRWSCRGRGKRGGVRVIYYHFDERGQIGMLLIYDKSVADDLTAEQKRQLRTIVERW